MDIEEIIEMIIMKEVGVGLEKVRNVLSVVTGDLHPCVGNPK